jgi:hypothetical protein
MIDWTGFQEEDGSIEIEMRKRPLVLKFSRYSMSSLPKPKGEKDEQKESQKIKRSKHC